MGKGFLIFIFIFTHSCIFFSYGGVDDTRHLNLVLSINGKHNGSIDSIRYFDEKSNIYRKVDTFYTSKSMGIDLPIETYIKVVTSESLEIYVKYRIHRATISFLERIPCIYIRETENRISKETYIDMIRKGEKEFYMSYKNSDGSTFYVPFKMTADSARVLMDYIIIREKNRKYRDWYQIKGKVIVGYSVLQGTKSVKKIKRKRFIDEKNRR